VKLTVYRGNDLVNQFIIDEMLKPLDSTGSVDYLVGRDDACHLVLDDYQISREHMLLKYDGQDIWFEKKSEFGSVFHNGNSSEKAKLNNGDILTLGGYRLAISDDTPAEVEPDLPANDIASDENDKTITLSQEEVGMELNPAVNNAIAEAISDDTDRDTTIENDLLAARAGDDDDEASLEAEPLASEQHTNFEGDEENTFLDDDGEPELVDMSENEFGADGFGDDDFDSDTDSGFDSDDMMDDDSTKVMTGFIRYELKLFGEVAPYDRFVVGEGEFFIGRSPEKCQIVLKDNEISTVHAVIRRTKSSCTLEDLGSTNGILLNGERINKVELKEGDEFIIGDTTFTVEVYSELLQAEKEGLMPVDHQEEVIVEEEASSNLSEGSLLDTESEGSKSKSLFSADALRDPDKRKKILYIVVGLLLVWVLLGEDPESEKKAAPKGKQASAKTKDKKASEKKDDKKKAAAASAVKPTKKRKYTPEQKEFLESTYQLGKELFSQGKYSEAIFELEKILAIDNGYKKTKQLHTLSKQGLAQLEELERKRREEEERRKRLEKVKQLLVKAREAVKNKQVVMAESFFSQIMEFDPENIEVSQLKMELDAWKQEQARIAEEKAKKEAERKRQVGLLQPGKNHYLKKEWYKAIVRLEEFLKLKDMDEDLTSSASEMLIESQNNLRSLISPLLTKARSLKEGEDLKGSYELYGEVLGFDPSHEESLNEMNNIREILDRRSKKTFREAIILESMTLFEAAKEKLQEVQQISPTDSEYYIKATTKLAEYPD